MATPPVFTAGQVLTAAQMNAVGLWRITGNTTFSAVANIGQSNVFTSDYETYLLIIRATTSSTSSGSIQLTLASTPASSLYSRQGLDANDTTIAGARLTAQSTLAGALQATNGSYAGINYIWINQPAVAAPTLFHIHSGWSSGNFTSIRKFEIVGMHETATAYDGWAINLTSGTATGSYALYGVRP